MSISVEDFAAAIQALRDTWNPVLDLGGDEWKEVTIAKKLAINAVPFLRLRKAILIPPSLTLSEPPPEDPEPELSEYDPEALPPPPSASQFQESGEAVYEIIHSPSYQVPVLYISLSLPTSSLRPFPTAEDLYTLLVPPLFKSALRNEKVGVLGALSATTNPETGRSCFWVHPCLTQEAMRGLGLEGEDGVKYLMGWIGIVGMGVGLSLPVEVAKRVGDET